MAAGPRRPSGRPGERAGAQRPYGLYSRDPSHPRGGASPGRWGLQDTDLAHTIIDTLVDRQATDVVLLDLSGLTTWADYFIIATVDNVRQSRAIAGALQDTVLAHGGGRLHPEGEADGGWVLIEAAPGVIVHLFAPEARAYYNLEGLWNRAQEVVRIQ